MARKKKTEQQIIDEITQLSAEMTLTSDDIKYPKITKGSHSTFIEHKDGKIEHIVDWDKLAQEINLALTEYENSAKVVKPKQTRTKKSKNEA